ncbi:hypothetical protein AAF712_008572 [Marasmius tenuissimus]|uniref:Uncharacterized protein n=1 Tax=Marasmius tenuissimus TaxID=585030 RepID=A0ABR2ZTW3_9AGAR
MSTTAVSTSLLPRLSARPSLPIPLKSPSPTSSPVQSHKVLSCEEAISKVQQGRSARQAEEDVTINVTLAHKELDRFLTAVNNLQGVRVDAYETRSSTTYITILMPGIWHEIATLAIRLLIEDSVNFSIPQGKMVLVASRYIFISLGNVDIKNAQKGLPDGVKIADLALIPVNRATVLGPCIVIEVAVTQTPREVHKKIGRYFEENPLVSVIPLLSKKYLRACAQVKAAFVLVLRTKGGSKVGYLQLLKPSPRKRNTGQPEPPVIWFTTKIHKEMSDTELDEAVNNWEVHWDDFYFDVDELYKAQSRLKENEHLLQDEYLPMFMEMGLKKQRLRMDRDIFRTFVELVFAEPEPSVRIPLSQNLGKRTHKEEEEEEDPRLTAILKRRKIKLEAEVFE